VRRHLGLKAGGGNTSRSSMLSKVRVSLLVTWAFAAPGRNLYADLTMTGAAAMRR